ncbi:hypothetical protein [Bacillus sp. N1-1]|uniref:hypothetical protein n=1 Tax=Bacillus sp. N1-1 TaxID=2682541 RepID=UPI0013170B34|nr:hypothetical protein [Bacillus sp. N1-1]QHA90915.1 hypothetical protein GNK04_05440 [Bacillus sp. N1-1]
MLSNYTDLRMKEDSLLKSQSREYSLYAGERFIGRIEEMKTSIELKNQLLKLINLHAVSSKHFYVSDGNREVVAQLKKARGFDREIEVFGADGRLLSVLKQKLGIKNQTISAQLPGGKPFLKAVGENDSFHLIDKGTKEILASIHKKSARSPTLKEYMVSGGDYHLHHRKPPNSLEQIILIGMAVVVSDQLHHA